jgi:nucleoside transporter
MPSHQVSHVNSAARSSTPMLARMSLMMFLQYWPLGTWGVTVGTYIAANTGEQGAGIFSAGFVGYSTAASAIGSLLSPVLMGFLSDRFFASQRLVALVHAGCAVATWGMYTSESELAFFLWLLVYYQCFVPAATLTNKIALKNLANSDNEYPYIRVFGTAGWIGSGLFVGFAWPLVTGNPIEATSTPLMLGGIANVLMAVYALTLPDTPPEPRLEGEMRQALQDSGALLANRPLMVFLIVSLLACIPSMAYNNYANLFLNRRGFPAPAALMTLGQVSDVLCLCATPWLIARVGLQSLFVTGVVAWAVRYILLAAGSHYLIAWPVYAAILIHGPCYVFIYVVGVMYVDHLADPARRGAAQGMYAVASTGLGHLLGAFTVGFAQESFLTPEGISPPPYRWTEFWMVPAAISLLTVVIFKLTFKPPLRSSSQLRPS